MTTPRGGHGLRPDPPSSSDTIPLINSNKGAQARKRDDEGSVRNSSSYRRISLVVVLLGCLIVFMHEAELLPGFDKGKKGGVTMSIRTKKSPAPSISQQKTPTNEAAAPTITIGVQKTPTIAPSPETNVQKTISPSKKEDETIAPSPETNVQKTISPSKKADETIAPSPETNPIPTTPIEEKENTRSNDRWVPEPNPFVSKFNTTEYQYFLKGQWDERATNAIQIREKYGSYCPKEPAEAMCPTLDLDDEQKPYPRKESITDNYVKVLEEGPAVRCLDTGDKEKRCGVKDDWLNKTIWPWIRGPFCADQDRERKAKFPLPAELKDYMELGYDRADPTNSKDRDPFDGGSANDNNPLLSFDPNTVKEHFFKFEAMLEHYYEGLAQSFLVRHLTPSPDSPLYGPMLKAYADQIARVLLRAKDEGGDDDRTKRKLVIGILGDSVTSGTDNCYFDAWPESLRRQLAPLFGAMGIEIEIRNAAKNGGWPLPPQMLCAYDMLGISDRPDDLGLDFLFQCNPFVKADKIDVENLVRKTLLGESHTVVSITRQGDMPEDALLENYAAAGLTIGVPFQNSPPELGIPEKGHKYWFPDLGRSFWKMKGDGFCHLTTRAGSSAVVNRNWHWGPKVHEHYADAYALLLSRATRMAIDELSAGRLPPDPPKPSDINPVTQRATKSDDPPTWREFLWSDVSSEEAISRGLGGVRCAVGTANQPGSTLLTHWLRPAEGSPFEEKMNARKGSSFVPPVDDDSGTLSFRDEKNRATGFYAVSDPISKPSNAVEVGDWVEEPKGFGEEAPRTSEQCRHVDGSTLMNPARKPEGVSWLVWEVPKGAISIGRSLICYGGKNGPKDEDMFEKGDIRFHYAVPDGNGWKVSEDVHKSAPMVFKGQDCMPVVAEMNDADREAARDGGMWIAVEWKQEAIFPIYYLVAM